MYGRKIVARKFFVCFSLWSVIMIKWAVFDTDKPARLTRTERDGAQANAVLALRMSILRKHLGLRVREPKVL